ncbi:hypothetical protein AB3480_33230 [Rhizobium mongolense]|uniref:hypothetical protein n=1 Tax=Rhizobium mongolense TaxID=57676 RepID=UPI0034A11062
MHATQLGNAVSGLWEAAIDATQWSDALARLGVAGGAAGACIISQRPQVGVIVNKELAEPFDLYFKEGWHRLDLRKRGISRLMQGEVLTDADVVTPGDIAASPFYGDFLPRVGLSWWMGIGFKTADSFYGLTLQRGGRQDQFTPEEKIKYSSIRPALSQLGRLLDVTEKSIIGTTLSALERLSHAAICLDRNGKVIGINPSAVRILHQPLTAANRKRPATIL